MKLPLQSAGLGQTLQDLASEGGDGITPQRVRCQADYTAKRSTRHCSGPRWARVCVNVPEFKEGQWQEFGEDCGSCEAAGRNNATSAGGWTMMSEWGRQCDQA
jgi:hypothetical protein